MEVPTKRLTYLCFLFALLAACQPSRSIPISQPHWVPANLNLPTRSFVTAPKGRRIQFGCTGRIRHTLSPENSSLTFATKGDLLNHWLCVLSFDLERDWMWDALQDA